MVVIQNWVTIQNCTFCKDLVSYKYWKFCRPKFSTKKVSPNLC